MTIGAMAMVNCRTVMGDDALDEDLLLRLCRAVFAEFDASYLAARLPLIVKPVLTLADDDDGQPIGFKLAYEREPGTLYSWLGGVVPSARRRGVASKLMATQHDWARAAGYMRVETRTRAGNNAMIIINLRHGFQIVGLEAVAGTEPVVIQKLNFGSTF